MKPLRYREYNPHWKEEYKRLEDYVYHILAPYIKAIHHIGSTSVESLGAKPIIDIAVVYSDHLDIIISILEQHGWTYEGEKGIEHRHAFRRDDDTFYEHHLYVQLEGSENLLKVLAFKRALQTNPRYRMQYQALKQQLIQQNSKDRELYTDSKTDLIMHILKEESIVKSIVFAGGCFWGVEAYFKQLPGVADTEVGYINGPGMTNYNEVCAGSGHAEAVLIKYDEDHISLKKLLDHLFNIIDPTSINKQGNDRGIQYRTGIYNYPYEQLAFIQNYLNVRQKEYQKPLQLELETDLTFYPAEDYHQDYLDKHPSGYCHVDLTSHKNVL
ncbi:peptide-methionine (S)-S-oxide reductase MsrA [Candidatus Xianfuyuplasma coldseepsis]|uniref:Peptide methionine sulfoxide reductase MsrA n=1 Tax=Candidatus Xianfuyuplasma coldseepsis TaxID=2782163 RepID=A0A7L7KT13_9MOLU|nr:peptide-methionine (S)-S-oxide reductase MsrA [Xianfuyuplasma coldseepsis]QMS85883.1 peptide-methionine (S)-S-oxide reductase MsrA [Xianfuyuplasma coldseepsis]